MPPSVFVQTNVCVSTSVSLCFKKHEWHPSPLLLTFCSKMSSGMDSFMITTAQNENTTSSVPIVVPGSRPRSSDITIIITIKTITPIETGEGWDKHNSNDHNSNSNFVITNNYQQPSCVWGNNPSNKKKSQHTHTHTWAVTPPLYIHIPWLCLWLNSLTRRRADAIVSFLSAATTGMRLEIPILTQTACSSTASMRPDVWRNETTG